ncbi:putative immunoglobulin-blocking virulence protein [Metamycoplasma neophronis]|uniref:Immunoglobulin-blocking virulence protein n=1 Tax=Metamycoplasma neophronis TaxID=872983 RepID=A0ABY2Z0H8_9BACT|nr:putative immunoglobulin-blocking virulence protein [Metamycoplasma neophronis]TPR54066.1 putative immunoglobulin-blocking virulence protein [Metamycoplasma neophronis]
MIKAKKNRLIKILSISALVALGIGVGSGILFYKLRKSAIDKKISINGTDDKQNLSNKVDIIIHPDKTSISDVNVDTKDKLVNTIIVFLNSEDNNLEIKREVIQTKANEEIKIDVNSLIPDGFILDMSKYPDKQISVQAGKEQNVYVIPEPRGNITKLEFFFDNAQVGETKEITLKPGETIDNIQEYLPEGYKLKDPNNLSITLGITNRLQVIKLEKEVTITIIFKTKDGVVVENREIKTFVESTINPRNYLPQNYSFDESETDEKLKPFTVDGAITKEYIVKKNPVVHITNIIFQEGNKVIKRDSIQTIDDQKITIENINSSLPVGYELDNGFDVENIIIGRDNIVSIHAIKKIITTVIKFVNAEDGVEIVSKTIQTEEGQAAPDISTLVPATYKLISGQPEITLGQVNTYKLEPENQVKKTTIVFKDGESIISTKILQLATIDKSAIQSILPNGYSLKEETLSEIKIGETNFIQVTKTKVTTTIVYKYNNEVVGTQTALTTQDEQIKLNIPEGYELQNPNQIPVITKGISNTVNVKPVIVKHKTILKFVNEKTNKEVAQVEVITSNDELINVEKYVPKEYRLADRSAKFNAEIDKVNTVYVLPVTKEYTTYLHFVGEGLDTTVTVKTKDTEPVNVINYVPAGYKLVNPNSASSYTLGATNTYNVEKIKSKEPEKVSSEDVPETKPETKPEDKKLTTQEIAKIIAEGGRPINANSIIIEKPSSLPNVTPEVLSNEVKQIARQKINNLQKLASLNRDITADDLKDIYSADYARNKDLVEMFAKYINGEIKFWGPQYSKEEIRQIWKAQIQAAMNILESELAKGHVPDLEISGNTWGYNLGINFGPTSDEYNPTVISLKNANKKRYFANDDKWNRTGNKLLSGDYIGWKKYDVSGQFTGVVKPEDREKTTVDSNGKVIKRDDGLRVYLYKPDKNNTFVPNNEERWMLQIDASNRIGLFNAINVLNQNEKITAVFIRNIGINNKPSEIANIYKNLPSRIKKLSLDYETQIMDGIGALQNKMLDEVELFTSLNNNDDNIGDSRGHAMNYPYGWGIDPNAFRNTKFISYDYNPTKNFENQNTTEITAGAIVFNVIRPDVNGSLTDVINGFRLALHTHEDWRVYNGSFGDGSWPVKVDMSLTNFTTLKAVNLYGKKFKTLKFKSKGDTFTLEAIDLGPSQYSAILANWGPNDKPKILFSDDLTHKILIKGTVADLTKTGKGSWVTELNALVEGVKNAKNIDTIEVENQDMYNLLQQSGQLSGLKLSLKSDNSGSEEPIFG